MCYLTCLHPSPIPKLHIKVDVQENLAVRDPMPYMYFNYNLSCLKADGKLTKSLMTVSADHWLFFSDRTGSWQQHAWNEDHGHL